MKFRVLSCNVFQQELSALAKKSPHEVSLEFLELGEHVRPGELRKKLQQQIDDATDCDAILLSYGLCGRSTDGLTARKIPLVIPRSHDCCGILLGSHKRFEELFRPMPSTPFSSLGFVEHGNYYFVDGEMLHGDEYAMLAAQYGEDDARYIWEAMHPKLDGVLPPIYFIHTLPSPKALARCRQKAAQENRECRELEGDPRLLQGLLSGNWAEEDFLIVPPTHTIRQTGDWGTIMTWI